MDDEFQLKGVGFILNAIKCCYASVRSFPASREMGAVVPFLLVFSLFLPFYFSVAAVGVGAVVIMLDFERRTRAFEPPYSKFLLCSMVGSFFVAAVYNNYSGMLFSMLLMAVVVCGFYLRSIMTRTLFNRLMDLACVCSVACALVAFYQKLSVYAVTPEYRPVSAFTNANYYGMMIEFVVLIACYRMITNRKDMPLYFGIIGINLAALYLTASMSSCAALAAGMLCMLFLKKQYRLMAVFTVLVAGFILASFLYPALFPRVEAIDHTFGQRIDIWANAIRGFAEAPFFGRGATAYWQVDPTGQAAFHCHNLLLDTLLNYGLFGAAAIGVYVAAQGKLMLLRFRSGLYQNMNILVVAITAAVMVHGLTDVTIFWVQTGMLFMVIFSGSGIGAAHLERRLALAGTAFSPRRFAPETKTAYYKNL